MNPATFPFRPIAHPLPTRRPILSIRLSSGAVSVDVEALIDSGADTCVLPYDLGLQLGLDWSRAFALPSVGGSLASAASRAALLYGEVAPFAPVPLGFAWVQSNATPVILGITNFFLEFDVCFYATRGEFTVAPRTP